MFDYTNILNICTSKWPWIKFKGKYQSGKNLCNIIDKELTSLTQNEHIEIIWVKNTWYVLRQNKQRIINSQF